jgi:predicted amidohydrolase
MEDQLWLVGCNETGFHASTQLGGRSIVTDPWGEILAEAGPDEQVMTVEIDPGRPADVRAAFPVLRDRRLR